MLHVSLPSFHCLLHVAISEVSEDRSHAESVHSCVLANASPDSWQSRPKRASCLSSCCPCLKCYRDSCCRTVLIPAPRPSKKKWMDRPQPWESRPAPQRRRRRRKQNVSDEMAHIEIMISICSGPHSAVPGSARCTCNLHCTQICFATGARS